jgi:hypothetical protein
MTRKRKMMVLIIILYFACCLTGCVFPYFKITSIENTLQAISPSYTVYTKNGMYLIDKKDGLSPDKFWKKATQKEIQSIYINSHDYLSQEVIIKIDKTKSSEAYLLTLKSTREEFVYTLSSKIKKGYFLIKKQKKSEYHRIFNRFSPFAPDD